MLRLPNNVGRSTLAAVLLSGTALLCSAQAKPAVKGGMNAELTVSSLEPSVAFYQDVLGLSPPVARFSATLPGVGQLTGTVTGAVRLARMPVPGVSWTVELVETTGVERRPLNARRQDIGASGLILYVRDLDVTLAAAKKAEAPIVTTGGAPVSIGRKGSRSRAIVIKDPDSFFIEVRQMDPLPATKAPATSNVIGAAMTVSIDDTNATARYWKEFLDFDVKPGTFTKDKLQLALYGTPRAQIRKTIATYPGSDVTFEFLEFKGTDRKPLNAKTQDPGSGAYALVCNDIDALTARLKSTNQTKILTIGGGPLNQGARKAMFVQNLDGFVLEAIQPIEQPAKK